jgi:2'-5' RNA ligase
VIRAFVGVRIDPEMVERICNAQSELKRRLGGVRWVGRENLHFTVKFLGAVGEEKIAPISDALERAVGSIPRFSITGRGIGIFPDIRRARVLWAGFESNHLGALAREIEAILEPIGFPREKRSFKPHLTIGRWRNPVNQEEKLKREIEQWKDYDFGVSRVEEVILFRSVLKPQGAVYSPLHIVGLSRN